MNHGPRSSMRYAEANLLANWYYPESIEAVTKAIEARAALCETGQRPLKSFTFHIREDHRPVLRAAGYELEFTRLAWARMAKWFGISRDFVRLRLKGGDVGRRTLESAINDLLLAEWTIRPLFMLYQEKQATTYTIRDLLREKVDRELDVPGLWSFLKLKNTLVPAGSSLVMFRLSDYAHQFRYHVGDALVQKREVGVMFDACLSFARKLYYAQGTYYWLEGDQIVMARADMKELGAKEIFNEPHFIPEAAEEVVDAMLDGVPTFKNWARDAEEKYREDDELTTFARVMKVLRNRRLPAPKRTDVYQRLIARAGAKELDMCHAIMDVSAAANASNHPEMGNRMERSVYDLKTGKHTKPSSGDLKNAEKYLRMSDVPAPAETVQLSSLSGGGGNS